MSLPSTQLLQQLNDVLLSAFDYDSLTRFAQHELEIPLEHVSPVQGKRDLRTVVDHLVRYCAAENGGLTQLINAAQGERKNHPKLTALAQIWGETEFEALSLPEDHPKLMAQARGVAIGGNVFSGMIITGDGNTVTQANSRREPLPKEDLLKEHLSKKIEGRREAAGEMDNDKIDDGKLMSNRWILLAVATGIIALFLWLSQFLSG